MDAGSFYQFACIARNTIGDSDQSSLLIVPVADLPAKPSPLVLESQSKTKIVISWIKSEDSQPQAGIITGYQIYMDNGLAGNLDLVFNGIGIPSKRTFEV